MPGARSAAAATFLASAIGSVVAVFGSAAATLPGPDDPTPAAAAPLVPDADSVSEPPFSPAGAVGLSFGLTWGLVVAGEATLLAGRDSDATLAGLIVTGVGLLPTEIPYYALGNVGDGMLYGFLRVTGVALGALAGAAIGFAASEGCTGFLCSLGPVGAGVFVGADLALLGIVIWEGTDIYSDYERAWSDYEWLVHRRDEAQERCGLTLRLGPTVLAGPRGPAPGLALLVGSP